MSMNYYVHHNGEKLHLGKSSVGWAFALRIYPERGINRLEDWMLFIAKRRRAVICDENGDQIWPINMIEIITERDPDWKHATPGVGTCVANGGGTWDLCEGDFC